VTYDPVEATAKEPVPENVERLIIKTSLSTVRGVRETTPRCLPRLVIAMFRT